MRPPADGGCVILALVGIACAWSPLHGCARYRDQPSTLVRDELAAAYATPVSLALLSHEQIEHMLAEPLSLEAATELALGNHRAIARQRALLAAARGRAADAWKPGALSLHGSYQPGSDDRIELDLLQDVSSLVGIGPRLGVARAERSAAELALLATCYEVAHTVAIAYYELVAAEAALALARALFDAAEASSILAARLFAAGNTTELDVLQAQDAFESLRTLVWDGERRRGVARANLATALGVRTPDAIVVAATLPDVPEALPDLSELAGEAAARNLSVRRAIARADAATSARSDAWRRQFVPSLSLGAAAGYDDDGWHWGPAAAISLPLFGQGQGARRAAEADLRVASNDVEIAATAQAAAVARARLMVATSHAKARHLKNVVLPLREKTIAAAVLQYNAMATSPFALLAARERQLQGSLALIDATKLYWQAMADVAALRQGLVLGGDDLDAASESSPSERMEKLRGTDGH